MRPADNLNDLIKKLNLKASADLDKRVHNDISMALAESDKHALSEVEGIQSVVTQPNIGRTIMKSRIIKLAAAAVIIALVVLGLFEFIGTDKTSGVVWADVARKIGASRGVIYRSRASRSGQPVESEYSIVYLSDTRSRHDSYKGEQIINTSYCDFNTKTFTWVEHDAKKYTQEAMSEETLREQHGAWASPKRWITEFLSKNHRKLGQKTINGVLCEGLETTDTTFGVSTFEVDSLLARIWVSVETGYPVMLEGEITGVGDEKIHIKGVLDQFQWDVELDPGIFEPKIPSDYEEIERPGVVEP